MKFSKIFSCLVLVVMIASCSKESGSSVSSGQNASTGTGQGGSLAKFTIVGNFLYAIDSHYLYSWDISNPSNPVKTNTSFMDFGLETIYPFNNYLFIGSTSGLYIYSLEQPSFPQKVAAASHARSCDPVVANDSVAFFTLKGGSACGSAISGLYVHDVKDIYNPKVIATVPMDEPEGLGLKGSTLYICCGDQGLKVYDVLNPQSPAYIKTINDAYFKDVIPYGDILICYVSNGIMLFDISNPTDPVPVKLIENA